MAESEDEIKTLLMRVKEESEKASLNLNIKISKTTATGLILYANKRRKVQAVTDFISLGSKNTADSDCSPEIERHLLLGRKAMTNLDSVLNSRDITLPTKVCLVKAVVLPVSHVWMWELDHKEGCAPKI